MIGNSLAVVIGNSLDVLETVRSKSCRLSSTLMSAKIITGMGGTCTSV